MKKKPNKTIDEVLLAIGGSKIVHQDVGYDDLIIADGKLFKPNPKKIHHLDGTPHRCHENSTGFYIMNYPNFQIVTGYCLADKGLWLRHSWLISRSSTAAKDIWETTDSVRDLYFGAPLNDEETVRFVLNDVCPCLPALVTVKEKMECKVKA